MDKYKVKLLPQAHRDIDQIYTYIASSLASPASAERLISNLEQAIFSLEKMPHRGATRKAGIYANGIYRQLFVNSYTLVYRINDEQKEVIIVTVRYNASDF